MATITAAVGGGNWTAGATWVGGVAPTAADDARLAVTSGNVTIDTGAVCRSLDCNGYVGTLTHTSGVVLAIGDATAGAGNIALRLVATMTYTLGSPTTSAISYVSTSATQQTITSGGKTLGNYTMGSSGAPSYLLGDANTVGATSTATLSFGTFNTGNFACSWGLFASSNSNTRIITLGSSAITITGTGTVWNTATVTGLTITANTAVITCSGAAATVSPGAINYNGTSLVFSGSGAAVLGSSTGTSTFANVTRTGTAVKTDAFNFSGNVTVTGTLTLTGNSTINRLLTQSSTIGTARTITAAIVALTSVDFSDITAAGAAIPFTGTSMGNALGNSNITFDAPATQTHTASAGGNWSDATKWTSRVPLPQDNVVVDVNTTGTLTADMPRLGADITFTGFLGTAAFSSTPNTLYGALTLGAGMTISGTQALTLSARSSKNITSNTKTLTQAVNVTAPSGTYTLVDAFATAGGLSITTGTFLSVGLAISASFLVVSSGATVTFGATVVSLTSTAAVTILTLSASATISAASASFVITAASANTRSLNVGTGVSVGTITYTVAGSTGSLSFLNAFTLGTLNFSDASNARSLLFTAGLTYNFTNFNVNGTAGKLMTIDTITAAIHTLSKPSGTVSSDYLAIKNSHAQGGAYWYAGANSVDNGGNTGWKFRAAPNANEDSSFFATFGP